MISPVHPIHYQGLKISDDWPRLKSNEIPYSNVYAPEAKPKRHISEVSVALVVSSGHPDWHDNASRRGVLNLFAQRLFSRCDVDIKAAQLNVILEATCDTGRPAVKESETSLACCLPGFLSYLPAWETPLGTKETEKWVFKVRASQLQFLQWSNATYALSCSDPVWYMIWKKPRSVMEQATR